jgi:hypothetical protein
VKGAPGGSSWRAAAAWSAVGAVIAVVLLAFAVHFNATRNWTGAWCVIGVFFTLTGAAEAWSRIERKRATGTYSYSYARVERARRRRRG